MAETSRSQVTITLGRSGQVVKRAEAVLDNELSDPVPFVGSKRSVRDRLGSSMDAVQLDNKRLRGDNGRWSSNSSNSMDDLHLSKNDLRFKIMKQTQSNGHQNTVDLRDFLSQRGRPSITNSVTPRSLHEPRHVTHITPEIRDDRRRIPEPRDPRRMPDPRDNRRRMTESRDDKRFMPDPVEVRHRVPERTNGSMTPWTLDNIRRKSPNRVLNTSRGLSPSRRAEEPQRRPVIKAYEDPRSTTYVRRDVGEISRPMTTTSFLTKPSLSDGPTKPRGPLVAPPLPPGGNMQRSQYPVKVAEHVTVEGFLRSLGLEKYSILFRVEEVDMAALSQMGDHDLKELGIPMGPRKKILLTLIARTKRQAR